MKRGKKMIALLAVLVLLVVGYQVLLNSSQEELSEEEGTFALSTRSADALIGLSWSTSEGDFSFDKTDDGWVKSDDAAFPVNQDQLASLSDSIAGLEANRQIDGVDKLEDYGLDEPAFTVCVTWDDESTTTYSMGDATPFSDGYYVMLSGDSKIYTTKASIKSIFAYDLNDLCRMEEIPSMETVTRVALDGSFDIELLEASKTINPGQLWYAAGTEIPMDVTSVETLVGEVHDLAWQDIVSASADDTTLEGYALGTLGGKVLTVYSGEEVLLELMLGATDENGDHYARLMDSKMVYTISADDLSNIITASNDSLRSMDLIALDAENVKKLTLEADSVHEIAADSESFAEIFDQISALSGSSVVESYDDSERILSIRIENTEGMTAEFTFYAYDVDAYACPQGESSVLLVPADSIDKLVRILRNLES